MDEDFHPEGKIPDGCLSFFSSLLYFLFIPHLLCSPLVLCCTVFFSPSPVFLLRAGARHRHLTRALCLSEMCLVAVCYDTIMLKYPHKVLHSFVYCKCYLSSMLNIPKVC